jgi:hypothetical protein
MIFFSKNYFQQWCRRVRSINQFFFYVCCLEKDIKIFDKRIGVFFSAFIVGQTKKCVIKRVFFLNKIEEKSFIFPRCDI